jgi:hypothetical protein
VGSSHIASSVLCQINCPGSVVRKPNIDPTVVIIANACDGYYLLYRVILTTKKILLFALLKTLLGSHSYRIPSMFKDNRRSPYTPVRFASAASSFSLSLSAAVSVDYFAISMKDFKNEG